MQWDAVLGDRLRTVAGTIGANCASELAGHYRGLAMEMLPVGKELEHYPVEFDRFLCALQPLPFQQLPDV